MKKVILLVEYGWRGTRELSLRLADAGYAADVIIKGKLKKSILDMIKPVRNVRIIPVERNYFKLYAFCLIMKAALLKNLHAVVVSKPKTGSRVRPLGGIFKFYTVTLNETDTGYGLDDENCLNIR